MGLCFLIECFFPSVAVHLRQKKQEYILSIELHSVFKVLIFTNMNEDPHIHDKFIQAILSDRKIAGTISGIFCRNLLASIWIFRQLLNCLILTCRMN